MSSGDWTAPGCFEVAAGIHRIPLPMPQDGLRAVNVYLVDGPDGLALIDGGWRVPDAYDVLADALAGVGLTPVDVCDVYVTHVHRDHYTMAPELRRRHGTRVHLGWGEAEGLAMVRELRSNDPVDSLRQLVRAGAQALVDPVRFLVRGEPWDAGDWEDPDAWLQGGPVHIAGREVEVVPTPGHTKGHVVLHDLKSAVMFTGDHVLPTITPSIGFELGDWELPLGQYLASLALLLDRPDAAMLPAHGMAGGSVHQRVSDLLAHHDRRFDQTLAVLRGRTSRTGLEVAERLAWTRRERAFAELDTFNRMIAVCETLAHLDVLVERGEVEATRRGDVDLFAVASR